MKVEVVTWGNPSTPDDYVADFLRLLYGLGIFVPFRSHDSYSKYLHMMRNLYES